jgi:tetratricopeptide (TPR) repeat protein
MGPQQAIFRRFLSAMIMVSGVMLMGFKTVSALNESIKLSQESVLLNKAGSVRYKEAGKEWTEAVQGQGLHFFDQIQTEHESRAALRMGDLTELQIGQDSLVEILPPPPETKANFDFKAGFFRLFVRSKPGEVKFTTPQVAAGNRGTEVNVEVYPLNKKTILSIENGGLEVTQIGSVQTNLFIPPGVDKWVFESGRVPYLVPQANAVQWWLFYPAVLDVGELEFSQLEVSKLKESLTAYRLGNILRALEAYPKVPVSESQSVRVYHASLLLAVGQAQKAKYLLERDSQTNSLSNALQLLISTVNLKEQSKRQPQKASEWLALSYYDQRQFGGLEQALEDAKSALKQSPKFSFALTRLAELEFGHGNLNSAIGFLDQSLTLSPESVQNQALSGFLLMAQNDYSKALRCFNEAIRLDGSFGNAWLGRGLCLIRQGYIKEGQADLQTAASLEPNRSLLHSYLGKAFSILRQNDLARKELRIASELDPNDPSPWLYLALINLSDNRVNSAILGLEKSIALNDNRYIYRSRYLLDQDRAVRSANLARLYQYNGMPQVAVREATHAVEADYGNASSHLFLANAFDALRDPTRIELRYETVWFHELLMANLLAPVGGGPLSQFVSEQEYSKLFESDGFGASLQNEWHIDSQMQTTLSLFGNHRNTSVGLDILNWEYDGHRENSDEERMEVYAQLKHQFSPNDTVYFLGKWQNEESGNLFKSYDNKGSSGFHFEEKQEPGLLLGGLNHQWRPGVNTLFLVGRLGAKQTLTDPHADQLLLGRDASALIPEFIRDDDGFLRFANPELSNSIQVSSNLPGFRSLMYSKPLIETLKPYLGLGGVTNVSTTPFGFYTEREFEIYSTELQHFLKSDQNTVLFGGRLQKGNFDTKAQLNVVQPNFNGGFANPAAGQELNLNFDRLSFYVYDYWDAFSWLTLIGGATSDHLNHPENFRSPPINDSQHKEDHLSAKIGFVSSFSRWFRLRGVYTEALGGISFDESITLEPVQLAGFNQAYRTALSESLVGSVEAPRFTIWGLAMEGSLPSQTWWGANVNVIEQDVNRTLGAFTGYDLPGLSPLNSTYFPDGTRQFLGYRERSVEITLNQLLGEEFSIGTLYRLTQSELRAVFLDIPTNVLLKADTRDESTLNEFSIFGIWNSRFGLFARAEANWYFQHLNDDPNNTSIGQSTRDGDDFWQYNAIVGYRFNHNRAEISLGVLNIGDTDYQLSPLNPYGNIPRKRTGLVRCRMNF